MKYKFLKAQLSFILFLIQNTLTMAQTEFVIEITLPYSNETIWETITNFKSYEKWNSVLTMTNNDNLEIGEDFHVVIKDEDKEKSKFKAKTLSKTPNVSFSAQQVVLGKWLFSATHHFIIEKQNAESCKFVQKWELTGVLTRMFRKQIFKELERFNQMNTDLKMYLLKQTKSSYVPMN